MKTQLDSVYLDNVTSDVTFVCGAEDCQNPEHIPAHKLVLAMQSPVFQAMFFGSMPEKSIVRITDATGDSFKEFLECFYKDDLNPTIENAAEVINLVKKYELNGLLDMYSNFLQDKLAAADQIGYGLELAIQFDMYKLQEFCGLQFVKSLTESKESKAFVCCSRNALRTILELEELKQYGREMFLGSFQWARNALKRESGTMNEPTLPEIRSHLGDLFDSIEFGTMHCEVIIMILHEFNDFFTRKDLATIHTISALKLPAKCNRSNATELHYKLNDTKCVSKRHYITDDDVITFQFSETAFFTGYQYAIIFQNAWDTPYNLWLTLTKTSPDPDRERDIVLLREKLVTSLAFQNGTNKRNMSEAISIEPNAKYELRIKPSTSAAGKFYTEHSFAMDICEPTEDGKVSMVTIEGSSPVISCVLFKCST